MFRMRNQIKLSQLHPHPLNPRKHLDSNELVDSIKETGLLSPIIVRRIGFEKFQIISGHRRKDALEKLGEKYGDCDVVEMTDEQAYKALMTANIQSQSLSEIEEAEGIKHMMDAYEWSQERVSKEFGKAQRWVSYRLSLLGLDDEVKEHLSTRVLTGTHAREIAQLPTEQQAEVARQVVEEKLSTRETAELVKKIKEPEIQVSSDHPEIPDSSTAPMAEDLDKDEIRPLEPFSHKENSSESRGNQIDYVRNSYEGQKVAHLMSTLGGEQVYNENTSELRSMKDLSGTYQERREVSDPLLKIRLALVDLNDDGWPDKLVELDLDAEAVDLIDKLSNKMNWVRQKIINARGRKENESTGGTIVEFRKKEA